MMGENGKGIILKINGSSLSLPLNMALVYTSCQSIGYSADLRDDPLSWVIVTPLSLSKECIVHCRIVSLSRSFMLPSLLSCLPMFKGKLNKFTSAVKIVSVSVLLSQSCGYYIHIIPELCFEFHVIDVGLIMALLRRDYPHRHQLIISEIVLETKKLVPWDLYALMIDSLALDIGSYHWPLIDRIDWVFDIRTSIHTQ